MNLQKIWEQEETEHHRRLFRHVDFKGGQSSTTTSTPGPPLDFDDLRVGRDVEAEDAFFGLFEDAEQAFLARTDPERAEFRRTIEQFDPAIANLEAALKGEVPTSQTGIGRVALDENLQQESNTIRNIKNQLAAGNAGASFFGQRLLGDAKTSFAKDRAKIIPDLINSIIQNQSGIAQAGANARATNLGFRTGLISDAANFSQGFNPPSRVKTQNLAEVARQSQGGTVNTQSSGGSGKGGIGQAAGAIGASLISSQSDRRLKTNIKRIGQFANGLFIYTYNYIWGGPRHTGFMADEVRQVMPEAVVRVNGYDRVYYWMILNAS